MPPRRIHWEDASSSSASPISSEGGDSIQSANSHSTAPTEYSPRPTLQQSKTCYGRVERLREDLYRRPTTETHSDPRMSTDTYASTSSEDLDEDEEYSSPDLPAYQQEDSFPAEAIPTGPRDFADLFPSTKRISIRHDDSTLDGNMNLRVDTQVETHWGNKQNLTLFHLRMHDLRTRDFSLRRYCRDSGREVCHSIRKYQKPPSERRPALQRSFSSALATLRHKPDARPSTASGLKRSDSGYESMRGDDNDDDYCDSTPRSAKHSKGRALLPTNTIKLEFSNYAHVDVKRRGTRSNKRYTFEYWGVTYSWKRVAMRQGDTDRFSYFLTRAGDGDHELAHIAPMQLSAAQAREEAARGGWISPCYLCITDDRIISGVTDLADVVMATGLIALVDDSIKNHFQPKQITQLRIPLSGSSFNLEYIGPKRLIDELFHRPNRANTASPLPAYRRRSSAAA